MSDEVLIMMNVNAAKLLWYPIVLFILFIPSVLYDILSTFFDYQSEFLQYMNLLLLHPIGFIYALLYNVQMKSENHSIKRLSLETSSFDISTQQEPEETIKNSKNDNSILSELSQLEGLSHK